jgi:flagellar basal-body rod protein FlgB
MLENTTFARSIDLLQRNMAVSTLRRQVISNNIANAETPNFKRSEVSFEAELGRALASEKTDDSIGVLTDVRHIPFNRKVDYRTVGPRVSLDYLTTSKNNGNNVDIEREMMQATENQMMYELMTKAVSHEFRQISIVLR